MTEYDNGAFSTSKTAVEAVPVEPMEVRAAGPSGTAVLVQPTQVRRPWKATARTIFQAFIGLCVLAPVLVQATGLETDDLPWLAVVLGVAAGVCRVMALPGVEAWLQRYVPWLAAAPSANVAQVRQG